jgi:radical SAM-linked protein
MTIARALAMGVTASNELCAVDLKEPVSPMAAAKALAPQMPPGLPLQSLAVEPRARKSPFEPLSRAQYYTELSGVEADALQAVVDELLGSREIVVTRTTKSGEHTVDIRPGLYAASLVPLRNGAAEHLGLELDLACSDTELVKPEEVLRALNEALVAQGHRPAEIERIHRERLW